MALALLQTLPLLRQPLFLARLRCKRGQFIHRVPQPFLIAFRRRDRLARILQRGNRFPPDPPCMSGRITQRPRHSERIQQRRVARRISQPDLFVLALHLDQQARGAPQQRHAHRLIVDEGARSSIPRQHAPQDHLVLRLETLFCEQRAQWMAGWRREAGSDAGLLDPGTHQPRIGSCTQRKPQTVQQDRLAGARLAGQHRQPLGERQVQPFDQHHVPDRQSGEHAAAPAAASAQKIECQAREKKPRPDGAAGPFSCTNPASNRSL